MSDQELANIIKKLPSEAKKEAEDFVEFLSNKYLSKSEKGASKKSIADSSFKGIWKDREDMQDSVQWVRDVRKSRWEK